MKVRRQQFKIKPSSNKYKKTQNIMEDSQELSSIIKYEGGYSNFFKAIREDTVSVIEEHFRRGERKLNENLIFWSDFIMPLPLIVAMEAKACHAIAFLLEKGAFVDVKCKSCGITPLEFAARQKDKKILQIIKDFKEGKDISSYVGPIEVVNIEEKQKENKKTSLKYKEGDKRNFQSALKNDNVDILEKHWEHQLVDLDKNYVYPMPPTFLDYTPLIQVIVSKSYNALKWLLEHGANPDFICRKTLMSPRQYAKENDDKAYQIICEFK